MKKPWRRRPQLLRCAVLLLQATASPPAPPAGWCGDTSAFIQRHVELHKGASEGTSQVVSADTVQATQALFSGLKTSFREELQAYQAEQERELSDVREFHKYIDHLRATFGRKGTLFGDMAGLIPIGKMNEADAEMFGHFLQPFRDKSFVKAVAKGLETFATNSRAAVWRTEKQVADLVRLGANSTTEELPRFVVDFFRREHHILSDLLRTVDRVLRGAIAAVPGHAVQKAVANELLDKFIHHALRTLEHAINGIAESKGAHFCGEGDLDELLLDQVLPVLNQTARAIPQYETIAAVQAPDVAPQVIESMRWLGEIASNLFLSLQGEARVWVEKVCGLAGAAMQPSHGS